MAFDFDGGHILANFWQNALSKLTICPCLSDDRAAGRGHDSSVVSASESQLESEKRTSPYGCSYERSLPWSHGFVRMLTTAGQGEGGRLLTNGSRLPLLLLFATYLPIYPLLVMLLVQRFPLLPPLRSLTFVRPRALQRYSSCMWIYRYICNVAQIYIF